MRGILSTAVVLVLAVGCSSASPPPGTTPATTTSARTSTSAPSTTATGTTVVAQTSGPRTVLSPIGLNVRADASKTATVLATAAQGATLTVLSHTDQNGGWYQVKGATVTGYITDSAKLSAPGKFKAYSSDQHQFAALYPETWSVAEVAPASVVFHPPSGADTVVATTAATAALLGRGRPGYRQTATEQIVPCGVTGSLVTFTQAGTASTASTTSPPAGGAAGGQYLVQVRLTLDPQHALGIDGNLADLSAVQTVRDIVNSLTFPFPQCEQGATPPTT